MASMGKKRGSPCIAWPSRSRRSLRILDSAPSYTWILSVLVLLQTSVVEAWSLASRHHTTTSTTRTYPHEASLQTRARISTELHYHHNNNQKQSSSHWGDELNPLTPQQHQQHHTRRSYYQPIMALHRSPSSSSSPKTGKLLSSSRPNTQRAFRNVDYEGDDVEPSLWPHRSSSPSPQRKWLQPHHLPTQARQPQPTSSSFAKKRQARFRVYCDLDGVLVDFCHGIQNLYSEQELTQTLSEKNTNTFCVDDLHRSSMWQRVAKADSFFEHLPWTEEGKTLWQTVKQLQPTILTGVPMHPKASRHQKVQWCQRELGMPAITHIDLAGHNFQHAPASAASAAASLTSLFVTPFQRQPFLSQTNGGKLFVKYSNEKHDSAGQKDHDYKDSSDDDYVCRVITCWSNNKHYESGPGAVLIDDRIDLKAAWEAKGGIFVHHNGNATDTIFQLQEHGVIDDFLVTSDSM